MNIVFLNGEYMAPSEAKISPMDRGFLFGDGIYEVIPSYGGKFVGLELHLQRMFQGLAHIDLEHHFTIEEFNGICEHLAMQNGAGNLGIYIQISRGTSPVRQHGFTDDLVPTVFAYAFEIPPMPDADDKNRHFYKVNTQVDARWQKRHIKSTSLLGNVLHYQNSKDAGFDETLLFNDANELTEAAACNVFIVKDNVIYTPLLDNQKLPGITRAMIINIVKQYSDISLVEGVITRSEVEAADEIWITSSSKQIAPVCQLDSAPVGNGSDYPVWYQVQTLFSQHMFDDTSVS
ncbi:aminotransferase class IV [Psychrosphaera sp. 1_MG-2023]|uniref:aminotransferase class IV n=1 Tax=Psychrosphaera sp. 1_MG-2023 TaxID=3062643 RepID=UPI0026E28B56|nr:aminotransferase class IV [Psychrosphaera sp. 1_MG-2023]MDO6718746.1 aminotransferase class IV [Psychrosphaera sp. 1_MG-2023]